MLLQRLLSSGSTWETWNQASPSLHASDEPETVRAVLTTSNSSLVSHKDIGVCEFLIAAWIRKRLRLGCSKLPLGSMAGLTDIQKYAAMVLTREPIACLTGLPGTGKTFVLKYVYEQFLKAGYRVALTSFTGSAASNLGSVLGAHGTTIHRLLEYNGDGFQRNEVNRISYDAIIVDEASLQGTILTWCLLRALPDHAIVILVGDPNQIPSIEPGLVLSDLSECVPHVRLLEVKRTNPNGPIGIAAAMILAGQIPPNAESGEDGFYSISCETEDSERLYDKGWQVHQRMADVHSVDPSQVRIMSTTNLVVNGYNDYVLQRWEPGTAMPVVARKNQTDKGYFNGDFGILHNSQVFFQNGITDCYIKSIHSLAFATTIFVVQGKQATACGMVIPQKGGGRPRKAEVLTAVSRARNRFCVVGSMPWWHAAIKAPLIRTRTTLLRELVRGHARIER